jgi:signal peptidase
MVTSAALPVVFGWSSAVVESGSMCPVYGVGDVVLVEPVTASDVATLRDGSVLLINDPARLGAPLLHRLLRHGPDGSLVTKGDANQVADSTPVLPGEVRGVARWSIPLVGLPTIWTRERDYVPLAWSMLMLVGLGWPTRRRAAGRQW